jgi:serine/threonine protein kinase
MVRQPSQTCSFQGEYNNNFTLTFYTRLNNVYKKIYNSIYMLDTKKKYLKYKQKYLNLKKLIGGGINASYKINGNILTLTYQVDPYNTVEIKYTILEQLGKGAYGIVYLIEKNGTEDLYIFKKGIKRNSYDTYIEGRKSNLLEGILDPDMVVLFQGKEDSDFLISTYNGNDLFYEFQLQKQKIKEKYETITTQLLELLHKINRNDIFHNDIKLANITIKNDIVYLIDFGLLSKKTSNMGTLWSMSYNGVIAILKAYSFKKYSKTFKTLKSFLKHTDMVGFFYCCIDLLCLINKNFQSFYILRDLSISDYVENDLYRLFELFYFILPMSKRTIPKLDSASEYYNRELPSIDQARLIFGSFPDENANLFRFMTYIYYKINRHLIENEKQRIWYKEFLKIMSACFLPEINYEQFKEDFKKIVSQFSASLDVISPSPPAPSSLPLPKLATLLPTQDEAQAKQQELAIMEALLQQEQTRREAGGPIPFSTQQMLEAAKQQALPRLEAERQQALPRLESAKQQALPRLEASKQQALPTPLLSSQRLSPDTNSDDDLYN